MQNLFFFWPELPKGVFFFYSHGAWVRAHLWHAVPDRLSLRHLPGVVRLIVSPTLKLKEDGGIFLLIFCQGTQGALFNDENQEDQIEAFLVVLLRRDFPGTWRFSSPHVVKMSSVCTTPFGSDQRSSRPGPRGPTSFRFAPIRTDFVFLFARQATPWLEPPPLFFFASHRSTYLHSFLTANVACHLDPALPPMSALFIEAWLKSSGFFLPKRLFSADLAGSGREHRS